MHKTQSQAGLGGHEEGRRGAWQREHKHRLRMVDGLLDVACVSNNKRDREMCAAGPLPASHARCSHPVLGYLPLTLPPSVAASSTCSTLSKWRSPATDTTNKQRHFTACEWVAWLLPLLLGCKRSRKICYCRGKASPGEWGGGAESCLTRHAIVNMPPLPSHVTSCCVQHTVDDLHGQVDITQLLELLQLWLDGANLLH